MTKSSSVLHTKQITPAGNLCGEGLVWDDRVGKLYWCDINGFAVYRYSPNSGNFKSWLFDEPVVSIMLGRNADELVLAMASRIVLWNPKLGTLSDPLFTLDTYPEVRLNDGQVAPDGSIWIGSMQNNVGPNGEPLPVDKALGSLFRVDHDGVEVVKSGIGIANTVCWDQDRNRFYLADSLHNIIWSHGWEAGRKELTDEREFLADYPRGVPDGSALDAEGYLWNCRFGGNCLLRISPDGDVDEIVEFPARNPTNCTFGTDNRNILFVTSAATDTPVPTRFNGGLFSVRTNVAGETAYRLDGFELSV